MCTVSLWDQGKQSANNLRAKFENMFAQAQWNLAHAAQEEEEEEAIQLARAIAPPRSIIQFYSFSLLLVLYIGKNLNKYPGPRECVNGLFMGRNTTLEPLLATEASALF